MATTITPIPGSATPYSKKYLLTGDNAAGLRSLVDLAADLMEGPLKRTLLGIAPANLGVFDTTGARGQEIRIYNVAATAANAAVTRSELFTITWVGNANPALAGLACTLAAANVRTIEIRLNHSTQA